MSARGWISMCEAVPRQIHDAEQISPLIPANAGTQMTKRRSRLVFQNIDPTFAPYDLGPGIRRDERIRGFSRSEPVPA
jgi:hypothetical protein